MIEKAKEIRGQKSGKHDRKELKTASWGPIYYPEVERKQISAS